MTVVLLNDEKEWDSIIDKSEKGLLFHKWKFLKIAEARSGYRFLPYGVYKGDELICVFPLFYKKENGLKMMFSPPPMLCIPYLGFVMSTLYSGLKQKRKETYMNFVIEEMDAEIKKYSPNYISISLAPNIIDIRPFQWNDYNEVSRYTYFVDLKKPLDDIWNGFDSTCRKNIKKGERLGLKIVEENNPDTFYIMMKNRYNEQGLNLPLKDPQFLKDIMDAFPENLKMYFLYRSDEIISMNLNYEYKGRAMVWLGSVKLENGIDGNDFLIWEFIKKAKEAGFNEFEIEGASEKRLSLFKSKFNPRLDISFSVYKKDNIGKIAEWTYLNLIKKRVLNL
jgi:hypothetical protein